MQKVKWGIVAAALSCLIATGTAWACDVQGTVICERTDLSAPVKPLANVTLSFTQDAITYPAGPTDANGAWFFSGYYGNYGLWSVVLDLSEAGGPAEPVPFGQVNIAWSETGISTVAPIQVPASLVPACGGPPPPPPPLCEALQGQEEGSFCPARPLGNEKAECKYFGLVPVLKVEGSGTVAVADADLVLVKAGGCYHVNLAVEAGDILDGPAGGGAFSHTTYCTCPPAP